MIRGSVSSWVEEPCVGAIGWVESEGILAEGVCYVGGVKSWQLHGFCGSLLTLE